MNGAAIRNGRIWRLLKVVLMSMAALVGGLVAPVTYNLFTTSRYNAAYPIPSISCGCGFREYFMLNEDRDRLVMWNAGHNLKREYFTLVQVHALVDSSWNIRRTSIPASSSSTGSG